MMDKRTILVVLGCMVALFGFQALVNKLYPPIPITKTTPAATTNAVSNVVSQVAATVTNEPPEIIKPAPPPAPAVELPPEQTVTLRNSRVAAEITSHDGGVRTVELFRYPYNGHGHVRINADAIEPALSLRGLSVGPLAYEFTEQTATSVVMQATLPGGRTVTKSLMLGEDYLFHGTVEITPATAQTLEIVIGQAAPLHGNEPPQFVGVDWLISENKKYQHRDIGKLWKFNARQQYVEQVTTPWGAVKNQFFAMILTPSTNAVAVHYMPHRLEKPEDWAGKRDRDGASAALEIPATINGNTASWSFTWYAGPKQYDRLAALGQSQQDVMQFGFWGAISVVLLKSMNFIHQLIPNYGIAIILITIAIKLVFWPIQAKSIKSMKEMQKFQPLMTKLREKYKDDPQRMNQEMMKLYKEHKINPLGGCLPMLVQIPVFFGLFAMLRSAIELRGASFLWIADLSQPDTIFHVAGFAVNPLPLLMTGSMVWQQRLTPTVGDSQQQKMMMFMPVIMLIFFYTASSGLTLYWTVQQLLSIAQQWWSLRQTDPVTVIPPSKPKSR